MLLKETIRKFNSIAFRSRADYEKLQDKWFYNYKECNKFSQVVKREKTILTTLILFAGL